MTRRSRLPVLIRLASIQEAQKLRILGAARGLTQSAERTLSTLQDRIARTRRTATLAGRQTRSAADLGLSQRSVRAMESHSETCRRLLSRAQDDEGRAREEVVRTKLRLRGLRNVEGRRRDQERRRQHRLDTKRLDETTRARRRHDEEDRDG